MAASAARHQHPARCLGRQRMAAQELGQRWGRLTQLPAVCAFLVALVPVARIGAEGLSGRAHASSLSCSIATCVEPHGGIAAPRLGKAVERNQGHGPACRPNPAGVTRYQRPGLECVPGSRFESHVHGGGEEALVLEGTFSDEHGHYTAATYLRNPVGSSHTPFSDGAARSW